jgi:hypothetical protein
VSLQPTVYNVQQTPKQRNPLACDLPQIDRAATPHSRQQRRLEVAPLRRHPLARSLHLSCRSAPATSRDRTLDSGEAFAYAVALRRARRVQPHEDPRRSGNLSRPSRQRGHCRAGSPKPAYSDSRWVGGSWAGSVRIGRAGRATLLLARVDLDEDCHCWSLLSLLRPQCISLRSVNVRSMLRFKARRGGMSRAHCADVALMILRRYCA